MARYDQGWVKLHRKSASSDQYGFFYGDGILFALWTTLIAWANYEPGKARIGRKQIMLDRGQVWTSSKEVCGWLGITRKQLRTRLELLAENEKIGLHGDQHGYIITILNYDQYQSKEEGQGPTEGPEQGQHGANAGPTQGQRRASTGPHSEEVKNPRREEGKKSRKGAAPLSGELLPAEPGPDGRMPGEPTGSTPVGEVWLAYAEAIVGRYTKPGCPPARPKWNQVVGGQLANLVGRIGKNDAIALARFYVAHNKAFYTSQAHALKYLISDAEGLYTQMVANTPITGFDARRAEQQQSQSQVFSDVLNKIKAERGLV